MHVVYTSWWHQNTIQHVTLVFDLVVHIPLYALPGRGKLTLQRTFQKEYISIRRERIPQEKLSQMLTLAHVQIHTYEDNAHQCLPRDSPMPLSLNRALVKEAAITLRLGLVLCNALMPFGLFPGYFLC